MLQELGRVEVVLARIRFSGGPSQVARYLAWNKSELPRGAS